MELKREIRERKAEAGKEKTEAVDMIIQRKRFSKADRKKGLEDLT